MGAKHGTPSERFWRKVDKSGACWIWTGPPSNKGYAPFTVDSHTKVYGHRFAYQELVGPIPPGLDLDHLCRNRLCVNPAHLEPVTRKENLLRGETLPARRARKTHCVHGHAFTPANTHVSAKGQRRCKLCNREHKRAKRHAKAAEA